MRISVTHHIIASGCQLSNATTLSTCTYHDRPSITVFVFVCRREGAEDSRGVRNVQTSCTEGNIKWKNPFGAIRVIFSQQQSSAFELCFVTYSSEVHVKISNETAHGLRQLAVLTPHAPATDDEYCVNSRGDDVVLFVESIYTGRSAVGVLDIDYDVRRTQDFVYDSQLFARSGTHRLSMFSMLFLFVCNYTCT